MGGVGAALRKLSAENHLRGFSGSMAFDHTGKARVFFKVRTEQPSPLLAWFPQLPVGVSSRLEKDHAWRLG